MAQNNKESEKFQSNLAEFKNTITMLETGKLTVLSKDEIDCIKLQELANLGFENTVKQASGAIAHAIGEGRVWIARSLSVVLCLSELEKYPETADYLSSDPSEELKQSRLSDLNPAVVEAILNIQAVLNFFLKEEDSPGKRAGLKVLKGTGHAVEFYSEGCIGKDIMKSRIYAQVASKWGHIRAYKTY